MRPKAQIFPTIATLPGSPADAFSRPQTRIGYAEARKLNAAAPMAPTPGRPAPPFRIGASVTDRDRAADCLAIAAMAEAGDSDDGQRAVIQVVLNRVAHPAFAKTVCGVVFEGSHRASGCQFTFTCDGALARRYSATAWLRARARATDALEGRVYPPVGLATHYHTDWVHPYWSDALTKLARIDTHLFFRWPGRWGDGAMFAAGYRGGEPAIAQLAYRPAHGGAAMASGSQAPAADAIQRLGSRDIIVRNDDGGAFVLLAGSPSATAARELGRSICMDRLSCKVLGWFDRAAIPMGYPVPPDARAHLGFSYFRDTRDEEIVLYDCARFASVATQGCLPPARVRQATLSAKSTPVRRTNPAMTSTAMGGLPMATSPDQVRPPLRTDPL